MVAGHEKENRIAMDPAIEYPASKPLRLAERSWRMRLLVGVHLLLAAFSFGQQIDVDYLIGWLKTLPMLMMFIVALESLEFTQTLLLSFWCGFGTSSISRRVLGGLLGIAYQELWAWLPVLLGPESGLCIEPDWPAFIAFGSMKRALAVCGFTILFLGVRRWLAEVQHVGHRLDVPSRTRAQFSIANLLALTLLCATLLGLFRAAKIQHDWNMATYGLGFAIFATLVVSIAWATMSPGPIGKRTALILVLVVPAGAILAHASQYWFYEGWLKYVLAQVMLLLPMAVLAISLLVVRSCGYRLVVKGKLKRDNAGGKLVHLPPRDSKAAGET